MGDKDDKNVSNTNSVIEVVSSDNFCNLSDGMQEKVLNSISDSSQKDGGKMGKIFGNNRTIAAMNIVFTICALLLLLCIIDIICALAQGRSAYTELTKNVIPIISLAIGYLLGKGEKE